MSLEGVTFFFYKNNIYFSKNTLNKILNQLSEKQCQHNIQHKETESQKVKPLQLKHNYKNMLINYSRQPIFVYFDHNGWLLLQTLQSEEIASISERSLGNESHREAVTVTVKYKYRQHCLFIGESLFFSTTSIMLLLTRNSMQPLQEK